MLWQRLFRKLKNEDGAYLIEASVVLIMVFGLFFVILIVMVNVLQTSHIGALAQDSLNYAIERCGNTFSGGWGRDQALDMRVTGAVRDYITRNTSYKVIPESETPKNKNQIRIRVEVGVSGDEFVGNPRKGEKAKTDRVAITLYLDTVNGGVFGNQPITVMRGGQIGQEWVRGMGDDP